MTLEPSGHVETTDSGRQFVLVRTFRASVGDVWASLTEPERLARWYGSMTGEAGPGRTVMITLTAEDGADPAPAKILECDPPSRLVAEFGTPMGAWRVSLQLTEHQGLTTLTFTHTLPDDLDAADVGPGWEYYADRLEAARDGRPMPDWERDRYQATLGPHYAQ